MIHELKKMRWNFLLIIVLFLISRYYSASIITMAGVNDTTTAIWLSAATSAVNFVMTFVGLYLVEKSGRRPLILGSLVGSVISLLLLSLSFHIVYLYSPNVIGPNEPSNPCTQYK